jgi:hypothetical protein
MKKAKSRIDFNDKEKESTKEARKVIERVKAIS